MDPQACWELLFDALNERDVEAAFEHAKDLSEWLERGGYMPDGVTNVQWMRLVMRVFGVTSWQSKL